MSTIDNTAWFTLTDLYKLIGPDLKAQAVVYTLMQANPMLADMPFMEANALAMHQGTRTKALPGSTLVGLNETVTPTKGLTEQVTELCSRYKAFSAFDEEILRLNGMKNAVRAIQDKMHIEGIGNDVASDYLYGNTNTNPKEYNGLLTRYATYDNTDYGVPQMIDGGDSDGTCCSVLFVDWAQDAVTGIYPNGTKGGIETRDHGLKLLGDQTNGFKTCYVGEYTFRTGIYVADPEYAARLCNLDVAKLILGTDQGNGGLVNLMIRLEETLPQTARGTRVMYAPKEVITCLRMLAKEKANVPLTWETFGGQRVTAWNGIPLKRCDSMLTTENTIAFS